LNACESLAVFIFFFDGGLVTELHLEGFGVLLFNIKSGFFIFFFSFSDRHRQVCFNK